MQERTLWTQLNHSNSSKNRNFFQQNDKSKAADTLQSHSHNVAQKAGEQ
jgi:hypothetical protein